MNFGFESLLILLLIAGVILLLTIVGGICLALYLTKKQRIHQYEPDAKKHYLMVSGLLFGILMFFVFIFFSVFVFRGEYTNVQQAKFMKNPQIATAGFIPSIPHFILEKEARGSPDFYNQSSPPSGEYLLDLFGVDNYEIGEELILDYQPYGYKPMILINSVGNYRFVLSGFGSAEEVKKFKLANELNGVIGWKKVEDWD